MKILLVNDNATLFGGAESGLALLADGLRARGHEVLVFASNADPGGGESFADLECFGTTSGLRTVVQSYNPAAGSALRRAVERFRPQVVHVQMFLTQLSPSILPVLKSVPTVYQAVWYRAICPTGTKMLPGGSRCLERPGPVCARSGCVPLRDWAFLMWQLYLLDHHWEALDLVVTPSEAMRQTLEANDISPVEVVRNGVPIRPMRPALGDSPVVAYAGRLVPEKGVDVLLRAFAEATSDLPEAELWIAGSGLAEPDLSRLGSELGLTRRLRFLGHLTLGELEETLDAAWVQVVPSRWEEPLGIVAIEAAMRGTAVVATRVGGLAEIVVEEETGYLVPPGEVTPLAARLRELLGDRGHADAMGRRAHDMAVEAFAAGPFVDRLLDLYADLVG